MKKILLVFALGILLSSCIEHDYKKVNEDGTYVTNIEYKGHKYLEFRERGQYGFSMIHDPECECFVTIKEYNYDSSAY